ncbi:class I SAM-dependent methyltransferase [Nonomuraea sp. NPDC050404]|uniref:class I SAM-dependent methyltransferase n=1 Tax=Nonomuraea sp. NPDC050404 TaxID=3155783 RepID=UPI00340F61C5
MTPLRSNGKPGVAASERYGDHLFAHGADGERDRLAALAQALDDDTAQWLGRLPIQPHWRCLDIGAGLGGTAAWLAERCPRGSVVATDIDLTHLAPAAEHGTWQALRHDVTRDDFPPAGFELIHARWVLSHLRERDAVLARMTYSMMRASRPWRHPRWGTSPSWATMPPKPRISCSTFSWPASFPMLKRPPWHEPGPRWRKHCAVTSATAQYDYLPRRGSSRPKSSDASQPLRRR